MPHENAYVDGLLEICPQVASVVINMNRAQNNVILGSSCRTLYGKGTIEDSLLWGIGSRLSPLSFYQVNRQAAPEAVRAGRRAGGFRGDELLVDLYCGAGTIGLSMAGKVRELVGVEIVPDAVENARENARNCGAVNRPLSLRGCQGGRCTACPRGAAAGRRGGGPSSQGLRPRGCCGRLSRWDQEGSSTSPATARRWRGTARSWPPSVTGLEVAAPVDLFPRTAHVECVALLKAAPNEN